MKTKLDVIRILSRNEHRQIYVWMNQSNTKIKYNTSPFDVDWNLVGLTSPKTKHKFEYYGDLFGIKNDVDTNISEPDWTNIHID